VGEREIGNGRQQARPLLDTIRQQIEAAREHALARQQAWAATLTIRFDKSSSVEQTRR